MPISLKSTVAAPVAAYPALKSSIVLFDCNPGTRSWTVPEGVSQIRAFVVGGGGQNQGSGGGYEEKSITVTPGQVLSYTVGAPGISGATTGGTSSFGGVISATGGATLGGAPGVGSGGEVSTSGGLGMSGTSDNQASGGASGHAFGNGQAGRQRAGGGFSADHLSFIDGWKIGLISESYGRGGASSTGGILSPGLGGGGCGVAASPNFVGGFAIVGGGGGFNGNGGAGLVGIEVIA